MKLTPFPRAPFTGAAPGFRFHIVETHSRAPEINPRDYVLIQPVTAYLREGDYLDANGNLFICQALGGDKIRMTRTTGGRLSSHELSRDEFEAVVCGYVVAVMSVKDHRAIREAAARYS